MLKQAEDFKCKQFLVMAASALGSPLFRNRKESEI
jgi:hypothetical protein